MGPSLPSLWWTLHVLAHMWERASHCLSPAHMTSGGASCVPQFPHLYSCVSHATRHKGLVRGFYELVYVSSSVTVFPSAFLTTAYALPEEERQ